MRPLTTVYNPFINTVLSETCDLSLYNPNVCPPVWICTRVLRWRDHPDRAWLQLEALNWQANTVFPSWSGNPPYRSPSLHVSRHMMCCPQLLVHCQYEGTGSLYNLTFMHSVEDAKRWSMHIQKQVGWRILTFMVYLCLRKYPTQSDYEHL